MAITHAFTSAKSDGADASLVKPSNWNANHTIDANTAFITPVIASLYQDVGLTKLMTIPNTASDTLAAISATQTLTNKTLTSPTINGTVATTGLTLPNIVGFTPDASDYIWFAMNGLATADQFLGVEDQVVYPTEPRRIRLIARPATAALTARNTEFIFENRYWTGAADANYGLFLYHQIIDFTPTSKLTFEFGVVGAAPDVKQALWSNGDITALGKLAIGTLTVPAAWMYSWVHGGTNINLIARSVVVAASGVCLASINDAYDTDTPLELRGSVIQVSAGSVNLDTGLVYKIASTQVVGARVVDARCDDAINSGDATTDGVIDALRDAMITHGLIAAA